MSILDDIAVDGSLLDELAPSYRSTAHLDAAQKEVFAKVGPQLERVFSIFGIDTKLRIAHFLGQCAVETANFTSMTEWADGSAYEGTRASHSGDGKTVDFALLRPKLRKPAQLRVYQTTSAGVQTTLVRGTHYTVSGNDASAKVTALSAPAIGITWTIVQSGLGNFEEGDGKKFKGRGFIQLTGRWNYENANSDIHQSKYAKLFPGIDKIDIVKNPEKVADPSWCLIIAAIFWDFRNINAKADTDDYNEVTGLVNTAKKHLAERIAKTKEALALIEKRIEAAPAERAAQAKKAAAETPPWARPFPSDSQQCTLPFGPTITAAPKGAFIQPRFGYGQTTPQWTRPDAWGVVPMPGSILWPPTLFPRKNN